MRYSEIIKFLVENLNVNEKQVKSSLGRASALKGLILAQSDFQVEEDLADNYAGMCGGKCPCRLFHIVVQDKKNKKEATVYSSKSTRHGYEKCSITTSPRKEKNYHPYPDKPRPPKIEDEEWEVFLGIF